MLLSSLSWLPALWHAPSKGARTAVTKAGSIWELVSSTGALPASSAELPDPTPAPRVASGSPRSFRFRPEPCADPKPPALPSECLFARPCCQAQPRFESLGCRPLCWKEAARRDRLRGAYARGPS